MFNALTPKIIRDEEKIVTQREKEFERMEASTDALIACTKELIAALTEPNRYTADQIRVAWPDTAEVPILVDLLDNLAALEQGGGDE